MIFQGGHPLGIPPAFAEAAIRLPSLTYPPYTCPPHKALAGGRLWQIEDGAITT